jgi:Cu(I)/Ag(I) efflux system membrane fusion protein
MKNRSEKYLAGFMVFFLGLTLCLNFTQEAFALQEKNKRKILYYRNPMNPSITSSVPAKDQMGMDYIPVYEEEKTPSASAEGQAQNAVTLSARDISLIGVTSESVIPRHLFKDIRTVGRIAYDPQLYRVQEELIQAINARKRLEESEISEMKDRAGALIEAAKLKLRLSGLSQGQIDELSLQKEPDRSLIISDKDNPHVWVYADIYEYELSWVKPDQPVKVTVIAFPGDEFSGRIAAIDPVLNPMTRSVRIRVKIDNPELKLKPEMYADIFIESYLTDKDGRHIMPLAVPKDAVLDTGMRKIVYLDLGNGSYSAREVQPGPGASSYVDGQKMSFYPIVSGLKEGDRVVTKGNFLIDSQSQISGSGQAAAYGGALGAKEETEPAVHQR